MEPTILCAMPEGTYRRMMTTELEAELEALGRVVYCLTPQAGPSEHYEALWAQADAALTGWGVRAPAADTIARLSRLRVISHTAGSVRMLPRSILERGIVVTSARAAIARTVGEFCLMNALILLRRLLYYVDVDPARKAFYGGPQARPESETLFGKTVGLIGFGCVGRHFRELLRPFGCRVLVHDPNVTPEQAREAGVERCDLPTLLRLSKVVSLHAPDVPALRGMIGARELELLGAGSVFLNSARGRLVDTEALTSALMTGRFAAAIDVTDPEPLPADHPLRSLPNVLFTPHVAGPTEDELPVMTRTALDDLARVLRGEEPVYPISLDAYDIMSF